MCSRPLLAAPGTPTSPLSGGRSDSANDRNSKTVCIKPPISSRTDWLTGLW